MGKAKKIILYLPVILALLSVVLNIIPDLLNFFDVMVGKEGLKNIISALLLELLSRIMITVPISLFCIGAAVFSIKLLKERKRGMKSVGRLSVLLMILAVLLTPISFFGTVYFTDDFDNAKLTLYKSDNKAHNDFQLLGYCISDYFSDEYDTYTVNVIYTGKDIPSRYSRQEYEISGYYYNDYSMIMENNEKFSAQIGRNDYNELQSEIPYGLDFEVTVYKRSRFIRSAELPSADSDMYTISIVDGKLSYERNTSLKLSLIWCGFKSGESGDITNALFGINADKGNEYPHDLTGFDEICLFAWADGGYKRVSNIIYKEDIN